MDPNHPADPRVQGPSATQDARHDTFAQYQPGPYGSQDQAFIQLFFPTAQAQNEEQAQFLVNVRAVIQCLPPGFSPQDFLNDLREHLPPAALFHPNVLRFKTFHRRLCYYMMEKVGIDLVPMGEGKNRRIDIQLAKTLYEEEDFGQELQIALNLIGVHQHWDPSKNPTVPVLATQMVGSPNAAAMPHDDFRTPSPRNFNNQYDRTYIDLSKSFSHNSKYGGDISETFQDFVYAYENIVENCHLPDDKKKDYISLILRGDAARYFSQHIKVLARSYEEAKRMILGHFHGPAQQQRVVAFLQSLRFNQFLFNGASPNDALNKLASAIKAHFPNSPREWQTEYNKIQVLYDAVAEHNWSHTAIKSVHIEIRTFEAFYARLANSLQKQLRLETIKKGASTRHRDPSQSIFFNQGRYQNPRLPRQTLNRAADRDRFLPRRFGGKCFNCGTSGHMARACKKPVDWRRTKANEAVWVNREKGKPANDSYGIKVVFFEMVDALSDSQNYDSDNVYMQQAEADAQVMLASLSINEPQPHEVAAQEPSGVAEVDIEPSAINILTTLEERAEIAANEFDQQGSHATDRPWDDIYFTEAHDGKGKLFHGGV